MRCFIPLSDQAEDVSKVRLKHPSEVVRPGDQVKCFVKLCPDRKDRANDTTQNDRRTRSEATEREAL